METNIDKLAKEIHKNSCKKGFWDDIHNTEDATIRDKLISSHLMLCVAEIAEAVEELRVGDNDKFRMELADAVIRLLDVMHGTIAMVPISKIIGDKMEKNASRPFLHGKIF